jgi:hypothetical protein
VKFLRSQGIVIVLAAVAVILVGKNLLWPMMAPMFARRSSPPPATAAPAAVSPANAAKAPAPHSSAAMQAVQKVMQKVLPASSQNLAARLMPSLTPEMPMNVQELSKNSRAWTSSPQRDPFRMRGGINGKSAREQLILTGILRQTASDLAVLNNRVLAAGDSILEFRVESVEPDRVWVSGPNGREVLEFKYFVQGLQPAVPREPSLDQERAPAQPSAPAAVKQPAQVPAARPETGPARTGEPISSSGS